MNKTYEILLTVIVLIAFCTMIVAATGITLFLAMCMSALIGLFIIAFGAIIYFFAAVIYTLFIPLCIFLSFIMIGVCVQQVLLYSDMDNPIIEIRERIKNLI
jgi:hypothetical protein